MKPLYTNFTGVRQDKSPRILGPGELLLAENVYIDNGVLYPRPGKTADFSGFTSSAGAIGSFLDIYDFHGLNTQAIMMATERNLYNSLAKHITSTVSSVDREQVSANCTDILGLFEITEGEQYLFFYAVGSTDTIAAKLATIDSAGAITFSDLTTFDDGTSDTIAIFEFAQISDDTGIFLFRRATDGTLRAVAFTYSSGTITWGTSSEVATNVNQGAYSDTPLIKGFCKYAENAALAVYNKRTGSGTQNQHYVKAMTVSGTTITVGSETTVSGWTGDTSRNEIGVAGTESQAVYLAEGKVVYVARFANGASADDCRAIIFHTTFGAYTSVFTGTQKLLVTTLTQPRVIAPSNNRVFFVGLNGTGSTAALVGVSYNVVDTQFQNETTFTGYNYTAVGPTSVNLGGIVKVNDYQFAATMRRNQGGVATFFDMLVVNFDNLTFTQAQASGSSSAIEVNTGHTAGISPFGLLSHNNKYVLFATNAFTNDNTPQLYNILVTNLRSPIVTFSTYVTSICMAGINNLVYCANIMKKTDLTNVYNIGITSPSGAVTLTTLASGNLTGDYDYVYSYYNSTYGIESGPSPVSAEITAAAENIRLTNFITTTDPQVDKVRIYRRKTSAGQTLHFLVTDVTMTGLVTFTDSVSDASVSGLIFAPEVDGTPPTSMVIFEHKTRLFYARTASNPNIVFFSEVGRPDVVDPASFFILGNEGGSKITAGFSFLGNAVIAKDRSIWMLVGDAVDNFVLEVVVPDVGIVNHRAFTRVDNDIYFMSYKGVHKFNGVQQVLISQPVQDYIDRIPYYMWENINVTHDPERQLILISVPNNNQTYNDTIIVYNYKENSWTAWDALSTAIRKVSDLDGGTSVMYGQRSSVGRFDGTDDEGTTVLWTIKTGDSNYFDLGLQVHSRTLTFIHEKLTFTSTATIGYYLNADVSTLTTKAVNLGGARIHKMNMGRISDSVAVYAQGDIASEVPIIGLQVEANPIGRR